MNAGSTTGATTTDLKPGGNVFRTRAADNWQMRALAEVLITDLNKNTYAIFQGDPGVAEPGGRPVLGGVPAAPGSIRGRRRDGGGGLVRTGRWVVAGGRGISGHGGPRSARPWPGW